MELVKDPAVALALFFGMGVMVPIIVMIEESLYDWRRKKRKKKKKEAKQAKLAKLARS